MLSERIGTTLEEAKTELAELKTTLDSDKADSREQCQAHCAGLDKVYRETAKALRAYIRVLEAQGEE